MDTLLADQVRHVEEPQLVVRILRVQMIQQPAELPCDIDGQGDSWVQVLVVFNWAATCRWMSR